MATASGNESVLSSVLDQLLSSRSLRCVPVVPLRVAVLEINRYLLPLPASTDSYCYDVTITDGQCRVKCYLAPRLNRLLQTNSVRCGGPVLITQLCVLHDERRLHHSCVSIEHVQAEPDDPGILATIKNLQSVRWWSRDAILQMEGPLQNSRKHYLALWNNEDPHGRVWIRSTATTAPLIDVSKISLLRDMEDFMCSSRRPLPLLVRVLHRSRLRYYGKPGQNIDFPYQAYFEVADQSGVMSMVLWNDLCPEWYYSLTVGSVLYLQHFTLKRSYQNRSRPQLGPLSLNSFKSIEICLNPRNPSAIITVIPPKSVHPQWNLPEVTYNFFTRYEIESLDNNKVCDIIGLVTYVGRVERIRNKGNPVPEKFWTYRWVHAIDGTMESPLILEIFASSQPEIFNNIFPMSYLVCTQMRVCREEGSSVYLTSSAETQLFITGGHRKQPYVSDPKVKAFIQWTKTLKDSAVMRKTAVGGYYCYPPAPPRFTPRTVPNSGASEMASLTLTAVADLQRELESMQYREHRRVAVQGHISVVQYHRWPPDGPDIAQQLEHDLVGADRGSVPSVSPGVTEQSVISAEALPSRDVPSPKRRRLEQADMAVQRQYRTRAKAQLERQEKTSDLQEEEEGGRRFEEESEEGSSNLSTVAPSSETETSEQETSMSWESSMWAVQKQNVTVHVHCSALDQESVAEKFRFDERDVLLHRINLSPAQWSPDLPSDIPSQGHRSVDFDGYFTLTILGLNQQAAVDALFLPVFSPNDPRAVGVAHGFGDNTLLSCLSMGCFRTQADFSPGVLLSSAPALEHDKVVCMLDLCLLGENQLEIICSKIYRAADIVSA